MRFVKQWIAMHMHMLLLELSPRCLASLVFFGPCRIVVWLTHISRPWLVDGRGSRRPTQQDYHVRN